VPSLKDIKRRIHSVQKTQQITSAMRMVAAAKLRRAQEAILAARPYADRMRDTLAEVAAAQRDAPHPLLAPRDRVRRIEMVVLVSDRGLCGAFNTNVLKRAEAELARRERDVEGVSLTLVGRKAVDFYRRRRAEAISRQVTGIGRVEYGHAVDVARHLAARYEAGEVDEVLLAYEIEPSPERLLEVLVPKALEVSLFRALLEVQAGEHAARMTAMESATRNTEDLIDSLTLQYNRARQAAITKELVEIVSGAEAL